MNGEDDGVTLVIVAEPGLSSPLKSHDVDPREPILTDVVRVSVSVMMLLPTASFALISPAVMAIWAIAGMHAPASALRNASVTIVLFIVPPLKFPSASTFLDS